jgi:hypothetical protein
MQAEIEIQSAECFLIDEYFGVVSKSKRGRGTDRWKLMLAGSPNMRKKLMRRWNEENIERKVL